MITHELIDNLFGVEVAAFSADCLGVATTIANEGVLTFLSDTKYQKEINGNLDIRAVFVGKDYAGGLREDIVVILVDDPSWCFFTTVNYMAQNKQREKTRICKTANIHPSAVISDVGVVIESGVIIEANVTIYSDVLIGNDVTIRAGAVLGVDGFEHKRTKKGILSVSHDGKLIVDDRVEIGPNNTIAKGFSYRDTKIGADSKFDALVHYAHGVQCGERCFFAANAMIAGHVEFGNDVWVGPSVSVSNRVSIGSEALLTLGSVVVRNVPEKTKVTGNFAIPHEKFIRNLRNSVK